jgi:hypothetical protein
MDTLDQTLDISALLDRTDHACSAAPAGVPLDHEHYGGGDTASFCVIA